MSKSEIARIINELRPSLTGGRVQKIFQPSEREVNIIIRSSDTYMLYFSVDSEFCRVHLATEKLKNPLTPFSFCQFLRRYITGTTVSSIFQALDDRVVSITLRGREAEFQLVAELFGRNGNIFLTDGCGRVLNRLIKTGKDERDVVKYSFPKMETPENRGVFLNQKPPEQALEANRQAEEFYREEEKRRAHEVLKKRIVTGLKKKADKLEIRRQRVQRDLASVQKWRGYLRFGELIKYNFHLLKKGISKIELPDYESGERHPVPLDPSLTPLQNMNHYFARYKKSTRGYKKITSLLKEIENESLVIAERIKSVENSTPESIKEYREAKPEEGAGKVPHRKKKSTSKPFRFISVEGLSILVGKSDTQNDEITFRIAKGNDLWFHARGTGGAHVVLLTGKNTVPRQESVLDAASLALYYSKLKNESKGEVLYTHRKYLKKPRGDKPGRVTYTRDKTVFIYLESARITRLMKSRTASEL